MALAGLAIVVLLPVCIAFYTGSAVVQAMLPVVLIVAALCLGAAVLRYRLFDVDRIVNRTVVYLTLSILLAAAYGATAIALGAMLGGFSSWTAAAGTLVAAAAFRPLRRTVQDMVDRKFYREKHDAGIRIDAFLDGLRAGTEQPEHVENLLRDVLRDPTLRVLLLLPASHHYSDVYGNPVEPDPARPTVRLDRGGTADVLVEYAPTEDPARDAAVRSAIERSRLAIEIARLDVDLNRQLAELDRSRARIANAADEERRRIQRDLHDGAQQRLVTVGLSLASCRGAAASGRTALPKPIASTSPSPTSLRPSRSYATSPTSYRLPSSTPGSARRSASWPSGRRCPSPSRPRSIGSTGLSRRQRTSSAAKA